MKTIINFIKEKTSLSEQECWWLLEYITEKNHTTLLIHNYQLSETEKKKLNEYIHDIANNHKPLAYILESIPFLDIKLSLTPPILIPRPETEAWVAELINIINTSNYQKNMTILDVGTGSGCIALSLAQAFPKSKIYALDINPKALELAQKNALKNNITNVYFVESNLFINLPQDLQFDLIVSNPPYIDPAVKLQASVTDWEDHNALFADDKGLFIIEQIITQAKSYLKKNTKLPYQLIIEIDAHQGKAIEILCRKSGFKNIIIEKDQFDRDRTVWLK